jgi:hypothetical protein
VRSFAESTGSQTIRIGSSNEFAQEMQILNRRLSDKSRRMRIVESHKDANKNMGNEWRLSTREKLRCIEILLETLPI